MLRRFNILLVASLFGAAALRAQLPPVEARIAGLEENAEYMALLREDVRLQFQEDSIVRAVDALRRRLRENPSEQALRAREILELENRIFEVRNAKGRTIDRINTIEQEWVLANLGAPGSVAAEPAGPSFGELPDSLKVRNLVANRCFVEQLAPEDYAALRQAQRMESQAADFIVRYFVNYAALNELAAAYAAAQTEEEALDIHGRFTTLQGVNGVLADSLARTWEYVFDNKSYAYDYMMDKLGREELLTREEERRAATARELTALRGTTASDEVAAYFLHKRLTLDYERAVAEELALGTARDSLDAAANRLKTFDFRVPPVEVAERTFILYDSILFSKTPQYTYQNPIPECRVYALGTIYRILLGTFNTKRAASTFRGAYPLCYRIDEQEKWCYFAGGFATREEAEAAQEVLKKHGFLRPEVVVWTDGVYRNLSQDPEAAAAVYRVEITGGETLSEAMKAQIQQTAPEADLSRVGDRLFVVGSFDDRAVADRLAAELQALDGALEIKVTEIAE